MAETKLWRAADGEFADWERDAVTLTGGGALQLDITNAGQSTDPYPAGGYHGRNFYNGSSFLVGEAVSPAVSSGFAFSQAIASWNADTPSGTWVEVLLRVRAAEDWSGWLNMGVWARDNSAIASHSVSAQPGGHISVATDLLTLSGSVFADAFQLKVRFFSSVQDAVPLLCNAAVAVSTKPTRPDALIPGNRALWGRALEVPQYSQMVYPDGGNVWCSPTSLSMALAYWQKASRPCEEQVRAAVRGVYDWLYEGHGNWPFNTAYAATFGLESYVTRFTSMAEVEPWIAAGVPVIISYAWGEGELTDAPVASSDGHLAVVCGFDNEGNPIVNDPAASSDDSVRRTYLRAQLESLWLEHSGGAVYLIYPPDWVVPTGEDQGY